MLADPDKIDPELVSKHRLVDDVPNHLRVRQRLAVGASRHVPKRIQPELKILRHTLDWRFVKYAGTRIVTAAPSTRGGAPRLRRQCPASVLSGRQKHRPVLGGRIDLWARVGDREIAIL